MAEAEIAFEKEIYHVKCTSHCTNQKCVTRKHRNSDIAWHNGSTIQHLKWKHVGLNEEEEWIWTAG